MDINLQYHIIGNEYTEAISIIYGSCHAKRQLKGNGYTVKGPNSSMGIFASLLLRATLKGKNLPIFLKSFIF